MAVPERIRWLSSRRPAEGTDGSRVEPHALIEQSKVALWTTVMAELINLRLARKRAQRRQDARQAEHNRLLHGEPSALREQRRFEEEKNARTIDAHRRERKDGE